MRWPESPGHEPHEFCHLAAADSFWLAEVCWGGRTRRSLPGGGLPGLHLHRSPQSVQTWEHPCWVPTALQPPALLGTGRAPQHFRPDHPVPPPVNVPLASAPGDFPRRRVLVPVPPGQAPTPAPRSAPAGRPHQPARQLLTPLDTGTRTLLMDREVRAEGGRWHTPAWLPAPLNPARGTKGRRRLTFGGSPLFGLQRREGAHDGPHGSGDLCATWDPGPCPSPPLEEISVDLPVRIGADQPPPGSSPAARCWASAGPGRREPLLPSPAPHTLCLPGRRLPRALGTGPGRFPCPGPTMVPRSLPGARRGAGGRPRLPSQRRVRCGNRAPPAPPAARSAPLPAPALPPRGPSTNHE